MPDINGLDSTEQELAREKCDFYDEYNRKLKGELVVTQRRVMFLLNHQLHHVIDLEMIRGLYVETTGMIGAYLRVDFDSLNGISIGRYRGSLAQAQNLMNQIKTSMNSNGAIRRYEETSVADSTSESIEVPQYSRREITSIKGRYDTVCGCGLCYMWIEVLVLTFNIPYFTGGIWRGNPGYALLVLGFFALTIALTIWWVVIKGKRPYF
ncbi:MAG: hypothetical protein ACXACD_12885 [Candidatus Thorarchaeota archaeon]